MEIGQVHNKTKQKGLVDIIKTFVDGRGINLKSVLHNLPSTLITKHEGDLVAEVENNIGIIMIYPENNGEIISTNINKRSEEFRFGINTISFMNDGYLITIYRKNPKGY